MRRVVATVGMVSLLPFAAQAHLVTTGLGPVYDGIGHLVLTPEDWVPALALALLAGLRGSEAGRLTLFALPASWLAGGIAGLTVKNASELPLAPAIFLALGILIAANLRLSPRAVLAITIGCGLLLGFFNGVAMSTAPSGGLQLIGVVATLFVLTGLLAALVVSLRQEWMKIAVRVAGSWIAALGLLMLGWALRA